MRLLVRVVLALAQWQGPLGWTGSSFPFDVSEAAGGGDVSWEAGVSDDTGPGSHDLPPAGVGLAPDAKTHGRTPDCAGRPVG